LIHEINEPESVRNNNLIGVVNPDLDSSNVLYDDDFEIDEEEKHNY